MTSPIAQSVAMATPSSAVLGPRPMAVVALLAEACAHVAEGSLHGLLFARAYGRVAAEEWGAS
jgi:hypothetical protein